MALSLGDIAIGAEGLYLGGILIGADNMKQSIPPAPTTLAIDYIIVAQGGGGGYWNGTGTYGGGGGGGGVVTGSSTLNKGASYDVIFEDPNTYGQGGTNSAQAIRGANSTFLDKTALGGGYGGSDVGGSTTSNGGNGGSGGGGDFDSTVDATGLQPSSEDGGFGNNGQTGVFVGGQEYGGGGGGAGTAAPRPSGNAYSGGDGYIWPFDLAPTSYGDGAPDESGNYGSGGKCGNEFGNNGFAGEAGLVRLRYAGPPQSTSGDIVEDGGYTYHTFTQDGGTTTFVIDA